MPVIRKLVLDAIDVGREPALGLFVGERLGIGSHGMVGYAASSSATIREAIEICERFMGLRISLLTMSHEKRRGEVEVRFQETVPLGEIQRPMLEATILSIKNILDAISMGACKVRGVAFPFEKPDYATLASDLFGCAVRYGQTWAGFSIPIQTMEIPLRLSDPEAFEEASRFCQGELEKLKKGETLGTRVTRLLYEKQNGFPSLQTTARLLHMTTRTLHRRLIDEGTSYRELLESVRRALAREHLRAGRLGMDEIAYALGYSDLANFRRAFKRWENVPPSAFLLRQVRRTSAIDRSRGR